MRRVIFLAAAAALGATALAQEWPTIRGDVGRTGWSARAVLPPYRKVVQLEWPNELIMTRYEPIAAGGLVYVGTHAGAMGGNMYAVSQTTGGVKWKYEAGGPIAHSPAWEKGRLYFAAVDGHVYCLDARSGGEIWKRKVSGRGGFVTSPCIVEGLVLLGARDGFFYAVSAADGSISWKYEAGARIANTAASDGRAVYFMSEDIVAHALDVRTGKHLWESEQLYGQSARAYYPVIAGDRVIFRTNPAYHHGEIFQWYSYRMRQEGEFARKAREERDLFATFFVLDKATGKETVRSAVAWVAGEQGVGTPPCVAPDGGVYGLDMVFKKGVNKRRPEVAAGYEVIARIDLESGRAAEICRRSTSGFQLIKDESQNVNCAPGVVYHTHQGAIGMYDLRARKGHIVIGERDTYLGEWPVPWNTVEWHGPERGGLAFAGNRIFVTSGSRLIGIEGR